MANNLEYLNELREKLNECSIEANIKNAFSLIKQNKELICELGNDHNKIHQWLYPAYEIATYKDDFDFCCKYQEKLFKYIHIHLVDLRIKDDSNLSKFEKLPIKYQSILVNLKRQLVDCANKSNIDYALELIEQNKNLVLYLKDNENDMIEFFFVPYSISYAKKNFIFCFKYTDALQYIIKEECCEYFFEEMSKYSCLCGMKKIPLSSEETSKLETLSEELEDCANKNDIDRALKLLINDENLVKRLEREKLHEYFFIPDSIAIEKNYNRFSNDYSTAMDTFY